MSDQARGIRRFVDRTSPPRSSGADGYVVAAGKGGVGTSTVALLLAFAARPHGPVVLVDAGGGFGGPDQLLGLDRPADERGVTEADLGPGLVLIHGHADGVPDSPARRSALRRAVRAHSGATVIVDAGSRPTTVVQALADFGTSLITVVGADGISPAAGFGLAKLAWRVRPETRIAALGNRIDEAEAGLVQDSVRSAARQFLDRSITWLGHFHDAASLRAFDGPPWATLDQTEPDLMAAAADATRRLLRRTTKQSKPTLHLFR